MITEHQILDSVTEIVFISSLLHALLPPWDFLSDFPRAQKYYKAFVYVIGYAGLNARSSVYQSLSTNNGQQVSKAVQNGIAKKSDE